MKLIIDIDDKRIKGIKLLAKEQDISTPYPTLEQIIANGIPLDKIRAEIEQAKHEEPDVSDYQWNDGIEKALEIIDKHKKEDEITEHYRKLREYYDGKNI